MAQTSFIHEAATRFERTCFLTQKKMRQLLSGPRKVCSNKRHIFIPGMQRSGTNMLTHVLERSFETEVFHETDPRAFKDTVMHDRKVIHALAAQSPAPVIVIKALIESAQVRSLMDEFAPSQALWIVRDFEDVINSALVSFKTIPQQVARVVRERDNSDWRAQGMSDQTYALLCRLHHERINPASAGALFWYFRNILYFEQGFDCDPRLKLVRYEKLVSNPDRQVREIFDFLNLRYRPQIARQLFSTSIKRRPAPDIEPAIRQVCQELLARFDAIADANVVSTGAR